MRRYSTIFGALLRVVVIDEVGDLAATLPVVGAADADHAGRRVLVDSTSPIESRIESTSSILSLVDSPDCTFGMWRIVFLSVSRTSPIASV